MVFKNESQRTFTVPLGSHFCHQSFILRKRDFANEMLLFNEKRHNVTDFRFPEKKINNLK